MTPPPAAPFAAHWEALVTAALLGTDRRDPPPPPAELAELVADVLRPDPASRLLAQVAGAVTLRRSAFVPAAPKRPLTGPDDDPRPPCSVAAARRWRHIVSSWPVLEDEWMLALVGHGCRVRPELIPAMLTRHRRDAVRYARVFVAAGPLAPWLVATCPELARVGAEPPPAEALGELPELPVPADLGRLLAAPGADSGTAVLEGIRDGDLGQPHRAVLINVAARLPSRELPAFVAVLAQLDHRDPAFGLVAAVHDVARTRALMLDELAAGARAPARGPRPPGLPPGGVTPPL